MTCNADNYVVIFLFFILFYLFILFYFIFLTSKNYVCIYCKCHDITYTMVLHQLESHYVYIITSLAKEVMFLVALVSLSVCLSVCLFICLSVDNITQKVMKGLG